MSDTTATPAPRVREKSRLYRIEDLQSHAVRLIEATTATAALNHVTVTRYAVRIARPMEVAALIEGGVQRERAPLGAERDPADTTGDIFDPEPETAAP